MSTELYIYDKWGKKRKAERLICPICIKEFVRRTFTNRKNYYCSKECFFISRLKQTTIKCLFCGDTSSRQNSKVREKNFCNRICKEQYFSGENHPLWHVGSRSYRDRAIKKYGYQCVKGKNCPLKNIQKPNYMYEVDHIDGNRRNNVIENLQVLCIYCHREKTMGSLVEKHNTTFAK